MTKHNKALVPVLAGALLLSLGASSQAQSPPTPNTVPPATGNTVRDPKACAPSQQVNPSQPGSTTGQAQPSQNLSDKLAQTDGVLCPPAGMDPDIHAPAPDVGTMPVIPPPGSPGGDPNVRPK